MRFIRSNLQFYNHGTISTQYLFKSLTGSRCLRDEISLCPTLAKLDLCDSAFAMGDDGLRCCDTCLGLAEDEDD